jgi:hypothetical protein
MKIIPVSRKRHYLARVSIFLTIIALTSATAGCVSGWPEGYYGLEVTSTYGGSVTTPGEELFAYAPDTAVELVAEPDEHHHFVNWTGDVDTIGNVTAAATNITMYDSYFIIANFELDEGWYGLTIFSNYGGSVIEPGEGYFAYAANTTIDLVAEPYDYRQFDYRFKEWTGDVDTIANVNAAATNITMDDSCSITANFEWFDIIQVAAGQEHTVGLKSDGTVVAVGYCGWDLCNVGSWTDIIQVSAGHFHTVGVRANGSVLAVGNDYYGQCNVSGWTGINQTAAGRWHTVGLKADGTVVAVGNSDDGQCDVGNWTDIVQVAAGGWGDISWAGGYTVGLKADGTVVAVGDTGGGRSDVGNWTDIVQVTAIYTHIVGLKADGTVVAAGDHSYGKCDVDNWTDITQVAAGFRHTVGLKADRTVVAAGWELNDDRCDVGSWTDIIQVAAGIRHTVGLKNDGTVVAVGWGGYGECNV